MCIILLRNLSLLEDTSSEIGKAHVPDCTISAELFGAATPGLCALQQSAWDDSMVIESYLNYLP
jgi:hypothetical protein